MARRKALIVGAGIAGPVLAIWLQRLGLDVVLVEARQASQLAEGAFLGVAPNGMASLHNLGLASAVLERGHACSGFVFSNRQGRTLGNIDRARDAERLGWPLTMIRRADLHGLLVRACVEQGVTPRFGMELRHLDASAQSVVAHFDGGASIEADFLVGCDGVRSRVRALAVPGAPEPTFSGLLDYGGFARVQGLPFAAGVNAMVFGKRGFFGAFTAPDAETWWFHNGPPAARSGAVIGHRARLLELHREDPRWISELIEATPALLGPWRIHDLIAMRRWWHGRVCLIGDAAHAMSPSAGQGASLAIEDAQALAQCLRDTARLEDAFASFERFRRPRVQAIFKVARQNSNGKAPSAAGAWLRDLVLPLVLPAAGRKQSEAYAYRLDWERRVA